MPGMVEDRLASRIVMDGLTARSLVMALLVCEPVASVPAREFARAGERLGLEKTAVRMALSRLALSGEIGRDDGHYWLPADHPEHARWREAVGPPRVEAWEGTWVSVAFTARCAPGGERGSWHDLMGGLRLAELHTGLWLRPDNLVHIWPDDVRKQARMFSAVLDGDPHELVASLWDLPAWARRARALQTLVRSSDPVVRVAACGLAVQHLGSDPLLPEELCPAAWPAYGLRQALAERLHATLMPPA